MKSAALTALASVLLAGATPAFAADTSYERLLNPEPQNWLMHHRDFGSQRHSPLNEINKSNVKNMRLMFAIPLGGKSTGESLEATPLVEDGFMYMVDEWGVVYKIDVRSGTSGKILWKMDPEIKNHDRNRGVALWGNLVISVTGYAGRVIATDKDTGKVVWDKNMITEPDLELTAAPLALKDEILVGGSGGDRGLRNWVAALDPKTGDLKWKTYSIPAPGEPGSETWKDNHNAYLTGGGAFYGTGSFDPAANLTYWGSGNPVPGYDSSYRPGDNLYTNSAIAFDAADGKIKWHFQYTPNDNRDYDEIGSHILIDTKINGEDRKIVSHAGRNGFLYSMDRLNGQFPQGHAACQGGDLDQRHRSQDRQAGRVRSEARRSGLRGRRSHARRQGDTQDLPRCLRWHEFLAGLLQPEDRASLCLGLRGLRHAHRRHGVARQRQFLRRQAGRGGPDRGFALDDRPGDRRNQETRGTAFSEFLRRTHDRRRPCGYGDTRWHHHGLR
jgi:PQQ-dependent dehydrogenase (methanol/ethanol family)